MPNGRFVRISEVMCDGAALSALLQKIACNQFVASYFLTVLFTLIIGHKR